MEKEYKYIAIALEFDHPATEEEVEVAIQHATDLFRKGFRKILDNGNIVDGTITTIESKE